MGPCTVSGNNEALSLILFHGPAVLHSWIRKPERISSLFLGLGFTFSFYNWENRGQNRVGTSPRSHRKGMAELQ